MFDYTHIYALETKPIYRYEPTTLHMYQYMFYILHQKISPLLGATRHTEQEVVSTMSENIETALATPWFCWWQHGKGFNFHLSLLDIYPRGKWNLLLRYWQKTCISKIVLFGRMMESTVFNPVSIIQAEAVPHALCSCISQALHHVDPGAILSRKTPMMTHKSVYGLLQNKPHSQKKLILHMY